MVEAIVLVKSEPGFFNVLNDSLRRVEGLKFLIPTLGRWDFVIELEVEDLTTLEETVLRIAQSKGVKATETLIEFSGV